MSINWSAIPASTFVGKLLRLLLRLIPKSSVTRVRAGLNRGMKWIVGSSTHGCWLGTYELDKQEIIRKFVKPGMKVMDVGANAGFYTLAFSRMVGERGHVWAFEPLAGKADFLLSHIRLNMLRNASVVQAAVADTDGLVSLQVEADGSMGTIGGSGGYKVPAVTLDGLVAKGVVEPPDLIKMDIEGAESKALVGARGLLGQGRAIIFVAMHGSEQKRICIDLLRAHEYRIFDLSGREHANDLPGDDEIYALPRHDEQ